MLTHHDCCYCCPRYRLWRAGGQCKLHAYVDKLVDIVTR